MNTRGRNSAYTALLACAAAMPLWANPAMAQAAQEAANAPQEESGSGEIIVTAQRREESVQSVGISVTALSGDSLTKLGAVNTQAIAAHVPGLLFDGGSGGGLNAFVSIRGVSQVDPAEHQEAPNAVYLDEVYVPTPSMVGFPLYDVARAEALRGPQGTLFGRNSTGGLLQFVTNNPTDDVKGFADVSYGNYNMMRAEAAFGGPITNGLSFRVAGLVQKGDGIFHNLMPGGRDAFETDVFGVRAKLKAEVGDWTVLLTGSYNKSPRHLEGAYKSTPAYVDANGVSQYLPATLDFYGTGPGNDPFGYRDTSTSAWEGSFNNVGFLRKDYAYGTLKIEGPVGGATFTSITNYSRGSVDYFEDADSTPNDIQPFGNGGVTRQFSQELRLSGGSDRLNWTAGVYYLHLDGDYYIEVPIPAFSVYSRNLYTQKTNSYAAFAQLEYAFSDQFKLIVGGRYTHDRKDFDSQVYDVLNPGSAPYYDFSRSNPAVGDLARMSHGDWTGKAQIEYTPNRDVLVYLGVSRGIRGGGFNASPDGALTYARTPFKGETVVAYEGGVKLRLFDNHASLRTSAFYYDYQDYQAFNFIGTAGAVSNNPASNYGGEVEFTARPMEGLNISLGAAYLKGKVKDYKTPLGTIIDTQPVKAPEFTFNGIITKDFKIGEFLLTAQYDFDYQGKHRANLQPSPVTAISSSWIHNARLTLGHDATGLEVYGFVRNIANTARKSFGYDLTYIGIALSSYAPPRTYGIGVRKTF